MAGTRSIADNGCSQNIAIVVNRGGIAACVTCRDAQILRAVIRIKKRRKVTGRSLTDTADVAVAADETMSQDIHCRQGEAGKRTVMIKKWMINRRRRAGAVVIVFSIDQHIAGIINPCPDASDVSGRNP